MEDTNIQEKYTDETKAIQRAELQSKCCSYVCCIKSKDGYFVEYEPSMLRNWETMLVEYVDGVKQ